MHNCTVLSTYSLLSISNVAMQYIRTYEASSLLSHSPSMYVCMYVYILYAYLHMYVHTYVHINYICSQGSILRLATNTYTLCTYLYIRIYIMYRMCVHMYVTVLWKTDLMVANTEI